MFTKLMSTDCKSPQISSTFLSILVGLTCNAGVYIAKTLLEFHIHFIPPLVFFWGVGALFQHVSHILGKIPDIFQIFTLLIPPVGSPKLFRSDKKVFLDYYLKVRFSDSNEVFVIY